MEFYDEGAENRPPTMAEKIKRKFFRTWMIPLVAACVALCWVVILLSDPKGVEI